MLRCDTFCLPLAFDSAVRRALQTAPAITTFLQWLSGRVGAENVDVAAHSLGNIIMFDALRLQERLGLPAVARNAVSLEGAVWREAFDPQGMVLYRRPSDPIEYTEEQLQLQSWAFWFNQRGHDLRNALIGNVYHSYSETDRALETWMRVNDHLWRGKARHWHYRRDRLERDREFRAPAGAKRLYNRVPALLQMGRRTNDYDWQDINVPIGAATRNPLANGSETRNAIALGWRTRLHSDHLEVGADDEGRLAWFPRIWPWYSHILGGADVEGQDRIAPAIPMGEE